MPPAPVPPPAARDSGFLIINISRLPDGTWRAASGGLPGLLVEADTPFEAMDLAREKAFELMELQGEQPDWARQKFAFIF